MRNSVKLLLASMAALSVSVTVQADENLFGYVRGVEVIPKGGWELYNTTTMRDDKGLGSYTAFDNVTEIEYGFSDRFNMSAGLQALAIDTDGLVINGYLPGAKDFGLKPSGLEVSAKYNILRPAADAIGLSLRYALDYSWIDKHSGQDKDTLSAEFDLLTQKYFMDGQLIWVGNFGLEGTYADRGYIDDLPVDFEWPTEPEMEIEIKLGTGLTYRFAPNWFIGAEAVYETEFETEVGQERWSIFAGPTLHYGSAKWWGTFTWFPQLVGGGEQYDGQVDDNLHLIEKTKQEFRLKLGYNF